MIGYHKLGSNGRLGNQMFQYAAHQANKLNLFLDLGQIN